MVEINQSNDDSASPRSELDGSATGDDSGSARSAFVVCSVLKGPGTHNDSTSSQTWPGRRTSSGSEGSISAVGVILKGLGAGISSESSCSGWNVNKRGSKARGGLVRATPHCLDHSDGKGDLQPSILSDRQHRLLSSSSLLQVFLK